jgi:3-isopropylmalate dehydrogenase
MKYHIATIPGDGIGPEVIHETIKMLEVIAGINGHTFSYEFLLAGGAAIDATGHPLPEETLNTAAQSDAVLLGAVGGPKWDHLEGEYRPERALLGLRKSLGLFANLRPAKLFDSLSEACPLHPDISRKGIDVMVVRELTSGLYFGKQERKKDDHNLEYAFDTMYYHENEIRRIARTAFNLAKGRSGRLTSVDKANILESSRLWRRIMIQESVNFPGITLDHMYVDNAAMQLVRNPSQFDVLVTENMFGDILSDEAGMITGSIGLLPSASLRTDKLGMYEPVHGSAPDIEGQNKANPLATILSAAMMLRLSFGMEESAVLIEEAVSQVLSQGLRTPDIMSRGYQLVTTREMGNAVIEAVKKMERKGA